MAILTPTTGPTESISIDQERDVLRKLVNYTFAESLIVANAVYPLVLADMTGWRSLAVHMENQIDQDGDIRCYAAFASTVVIETGLPQLCTTTLDDTVQKFVLACSDRNPVIYTTAIVDYPCPPYVLVAFDADGAAPGTGTVLTVNLIYSR